MPDSKLNLRVLMSSLNAVEDMIVRLCIHLWVLEKIRSTAPVQKSGFFLEKDPT